MSGSRGRSMSSVATNSISGLTRPLEIQAGTVDSHVYLQDGLPFSGGGGSHLYELSGDALWKIEQQSPLGSDVHITGVVAYALKTDSVVTLQILSSDPIPDLGQGDYNGFIHCVIPADICPSYEHGPVYQIASNVLNNVISSRIAVSGFTRTDLLFSDPDGEILSNISAGQPFALNTLTYRADPLGP